VRAEVLKMLRRVSLDRGNASNVVLGALPSVVVKDLHGALWLAMLWGQLHVEKSV
jgi:hypothetical protein